MHRTFLLSVFNMFIPILGSSRQKIQAPQTIPLAPGASIGENTVCDIGASIRSSACSHPSNCVNTLCEHFTQKTS